MGSVQLHVQDFYHEPKTNPTNTCFDITHMEEDRQPTSCGSGGGQERLIRLDGEQEDLLDVNHSSIFYNDFPPLPDFHCMSSTSSSSSTPATFKEVASSSSSSSVSSSSSAASWAVLKSDGEDDAEKKNNYDHDQCQNCSQYDNNQVEQQKSTATAAAALSSTVSMEITQVSDQGAGGDGTVVSCMDVMENFGYMDLIDDNDFFDPSSIFNSSENFLEEFQHEQNLQQPEQNQPPPQQQEITENKQMQLQMGCEDGGQIKLNSPSDDLAMVFLEWLKSNKETVSAEDLRNVKIKKATIECAAKRLGGGKEAMKQLLKLILEWVQTNHLQKRKAKESELDSLQNPHSLTSNPSLSYNSNSISILPGQSKTHCFTQSQCIPPQPQPYVAADPVSGMSGYSTMVGYPYGNGAPNMSSHGHSYPEYHMLESAQSWPQPQFGFVTHYNAYSDPGQPHQPLFSGYGNQYPNPCQYMQGQVGDNRLVRLGSSATKEARKKRMARQKRFLLHNRNHSHNYNQQNQQQNQAAAQQNPGNWVYWHSGAVVNPPPGSTVPGVPLDEQSVHTGDRPPSMQSGQTQNNQPRQGGSDKPQNWKPEMNLRFLLQKVLKQSDVGTLGRIVLPKKEAETHLPELEARDGICIAMEDIGTSRVWNMRYRFWPNNKSRMYLLENTGDFVRTNGLQEGDFIVIYSDVRCGKYLIRGVKVRQGGGTKAENKKGAKSQKNTHASSPGAANKNNNEFKSK